MGDLQRLGGCHRTLDQWRAQSALVNWKGPIMRKMPSPLHRAAGTAASALVLVSGGLAASTAFAQQADLNGLYHAGQNNDFGARQDASVLRAAKAAPSTVQLTAEQRKTLN